MKHKVPLLIGAKVKMNTLKDLHETHLWVAKIAEDHDVINTGCGACDCDMDSAIAREACLGDHTKVC